jgi:hypothetical protein
VGLGSAVSVGGTGVGVLFGLGPSAPQAMRNGRIRISE